MYNNNWIIVVVTNNAMNDMQIKLNYIKYTYKFICVYTSSILTFNCVQGVRMNSNSLLCHRNFSRNTSNPLTVLTFAFQSNPESCKLLGSNFFCTLWNCTLSSQSTLDIADKPSLTNHSDFQALVNLPIRCFYFINKNNATSFSILMCR